MKRGAELVPQRTKARSLLLWSLRSLCLPVWESALYFHLSIQWAGSRPVDMKIIQRDVEEMCWNCIRIAEPLSNRKEVVWRLSWIPEMLLVVGVSNSYKCKWKSKQVELRIFLLNGMFGPHWNADFLLCRWKHDPNYSHLFINFHLINIMKLGVLFHFHESL